MFDFKSISIDSVFTWIVTLFGAGSLGYFVKSKKQKKADDDNSTASSIKEWAEAFKLVTKPLSDEISHVRSEFKELQEKYIQLSIDVGVMTRENERKDKRIMELERENLELKDRIKQLEAA